MERTKLRLNTFVARFYTAKSTFSSIDARVKPIDFGIESAYVAAKLGVPLGHFDRQYMIADVTDWRVVSLLQGSDASIVFF